MVRSLAIVNGQEAMNTKEKLGAAIVIGVDIRLGAEGWIE
jgi:hypothetical protein